MKVTEAMKRKVFFQIEDDPVEAAVMTLKSSLMILCAVLIENMDIKEVSKRTKISVTKINELKSGRINKLTLEKLLTIALNLGLTLDSNLNLTSNNPLTIDIRLDHD